MGKPREEGNIFFTAKKQTKLDLNHAIRDNVNCKQREENNTLMEANFRNPKLFSKLVNRNRKTTQGYTAMIKVDNKEYRGDAQVLFLSC